MTAKAQAVVGRVKQVFNNQVNDLCRSDYADVCSALSTEFDDLATVSKEELERLGD